MSKAVLLIVLLLALAGAAHGAFPGRDGVLVFDVDRTGDGNSEIYRINADGSGETRLTNAPGADTEATFSPDGKLIAFDSRRDGNPEIYVMNADGGDPRRLTSNPAEDRQPTWLGSGRIAFVSNRDGQYEIYVMNADGSNQTNVTQHPRRDLNPSGSAGDAIAFASDREGGTNWEIFTINADGSGLRRLTEHAAVDNAPDWSPDGRRIVFTSFRDGRDELYVMDSSGGGQARLTSNGWRNLTAAWSPAGTRIAYVSAPEGAPPGTVHIFTANADGSGATQLTTQRGPNLRPEWQPIPLPPPPPPPPSPPPPPPPTSPLSRVSLGAPKLAPAAPRAGARLVVSAATRPRIDDGDVTCNARAGTAALKVLRAALAAGRVSCTFALPRTARGKQLRGRLAVSSEDGSGSRSFSARIR